ncbi:MAG: PH domain-containing protein [Candidatus Heimdallarchaeota archaeon]|nr:PH domain-containing protein [Candidatus Heimdallarchaeota archaeon]
MNDESLNLTKMGKHKIIEQFTPDNSKLFTIWVVEILLIYIVGTGIAVLLTFTLSLSEDISITLSDLYTLAYPWFFGFSVPLIVLGIVFVFVYIRQIKYSLTTHEIIVEKGIITKSRKVVPYRNITNFNQRRGPFDRLIGGPSFGTIGIETAGMSGSSGQKSRPEQKLVGINDTNEYTEKIRNILSKMRGQAAVTADSETAPMLNEEELLKEMLLTLKEIAKKI